MLRRTTTPGREALTIIYWGGAHKYSICATPSAAVLRRATTPGSEALTIFFTWEGDAHKYSKIVTTPAAAGLRRATTPGKGKRSQFVLHGRGTLTNIQ